MTGEQVVNVEDVKPGDTLIHDPNLEPKRYERSWPLKWTVLDVTFPESGVIVIDLMSHDKAPWGGKKIRGYRRGETVTVRRA